MSLEQILVPANNLQLGMYVSKLDRPWLETPFLFQGFCIESPEEIEELKRYCEYVYVDVERSDADLAGKIPGTNGSRSTTVARRSHPSKRRSRKKRARRKDQTDHSTQSTDSETDENTVRLKEELVHARFAHQELTTAFEDVFGALQSGDKVDISVLQKSIDPMVDSITRNEDAMSWLARMKRKHDYVYDHSIASAVWAVMFGRHLGLDKKDLQVVGIGAMFMDVGKTKIPTALLTKPADLTGEEMALMQKHVGYGVEIVRRIKGVDERVVAMVQSHHERHNGTGYPQRLSGTEIPPFGRLAGIVDAYDAMTTPRPYAEPMSTYDAIRQLNNLAGVEFQAEIVEQFVQAVGVFPVGTLVELSTGQVGVIISQNRMRRLRPKVMVLLDNNKNPLERFPIVDLRSQLVDEDGQTSLWITCGLPPGAYGLDPAEYYL